MRSAQRWLRAAIRRKTSEIRFPHSAKTPRMETGASVIGQAARPRQVKHRRYELAGWEFKPDKKGVRQKRAILRELPSE
jgi:hypothetical protein